MKIVTRTYVTRSLCDCGFPVLLDEIPLGRVYVVDEDSAREGASLICGGCRAVIQVTTIEALDARAVFMPLPLGIFLPKPNEVGG